MKNVKKMVEMFGEVEICTVFDLEDPESGHYLQNSINLAEDQGHKFFTFETIDFSEDIKALRNSIDAEFHRLRELAAKHEGIDTSDKQAFMFWFPSKDNPYNSTLVKLEKANEGLL